LKVSWCISKVDASFLAAMEDVLDVYAQPYDPAYPVICFDERPCFLIADTITPIPTQSGKIAKESITATRRTVPVVCWQP
jgi:hypothetical protein